MNNRLRVLTALILLTSNVFAQNTRLSLELSGGIPYAFTSISSSISTFGGIGLRYNISKELSVQGALNIGSLSGSQVAGASFISPDALSNYKSFNNNFIHYSINGQLNIERVFGLRSFFKRINPFLVVGGGYTSSSVIAYRNVDNNKKYNQNFYTGYAGIALRYYLNPQIDLVFNSHYNVTQTYYLDGIYMDNTYDAFLLTSVGVNYKFGAKSQKQHIEWNNLILNNRVYIPDIEKRNGQPIDEEGNYVVYSKDSVSKLIAANQQLQAQNETQRSEIERQRKEIDSLKDDMNKVKGQIDTMSNAIQELKKQNQEILNKVNSQSPAQPKTQSAPPSTYVPSEPTPPIPPPVAPKPVNENTGSGSGDNNTAKKQPTTTQPVVVTPPAKEKKSEPVSNVPSAVRKDPVEPESPKQQPSESTVTGLNEIDGVVAPLERYNVVAGAYVGTKYATIFRDKMRAKGYEAAIFRSDINSKILRVCVISTSDKKEAIRVMNKLRKDGNSGAWIHVYQVK